MGLSKRFTLSTVGADLRISITDTQHGQFEEVGEAMQQTQQVGGHLRWNEKLQFDTGRSQGGAPPPGLLDVEVPWFANASTSTNAFHESVSKCVRAIRVQETPTSPLLSHKKRDTEVIHAHTTRGTLSVLLAALLPV